MMKGYAYSLSILTLLVSAPALSLSDTIKNELMYVDKPWTITHLDDLQMDCLWTRDDAGRLHSEATGPDGSGMCYDAKADDQVNKLDKENKLVWHNPPRFDHEYGDKNKCYYRVDKTIGLVQLLFGNGDVSEAEANECRKDSSMDRALRNATPVVSDFQKIVMAQINACYAGMNGTLTGDWSTQMVKYATITSQFKGNSGAISRIGRAFDYGKLLANSPNDCVNFVTRS